MDGISKIRKYVPIMDQCGLFGVWHFESGQIERIKFSHQHQKKSHSYVTVIDELTNFWFIFYFFWQKWRGIKVQGTNQLTQMQKSYQRPDPSPKWAAGLVLVFALFNKLLQKGHPFTWQNNFDWRFSIGEQCENPTIRKPET